MYIWRVSIFLLRIKFLPKLGGKMQAEKKIQCFQNKMNKCMFYYQTFSGPQNTKEKNVLYQRKLFLIIFGNHIPKTTKHIVYQELSPNST